MQGRPTVGGNLDNRRPSPSLWWTWWTSCRHHPSRMASNPFSSSLNVVYRRAEVINAPTPADRVKTCVVDTRNISNIHIGAYLHTGKRYSTAVKRLGGFRSNAVRPSIKSSSNAIKSPSNAPKRYQTPPQTLPNAPSNDLKRPSNAPKRLLKRSQMLSNAPKRPSNAPKRPLKRSQTPPQTLSNALKHPLKRYQTLINAKHRSVL